MAEQGKPSNNVYTVLVGIAFLVLLLGVAYVWYRTSQLTGETNPFAVSAAPAAEMLRAVGFA